MNPRTRLAPTQPHRDAAVIAHAAAALAGMRELGTSLVHAVVLTDDGFEVVRTPATAHDGRLASMASSIQALADAVAAESKLGASEVVIIAADAGHVIQRRVFGRELVLAAVFDSGETLGKALAITKLTAERLSTQPE